MTGCPVWIWSDDDKMMISIWISINVFVSRERTPPCSAVHDGGTSAWSKAEAPCLAPRSCRPPS